MVDASTKENRSYMYSVSYWASNIAFSIGTMVGGTYFKTYPFPLFLAIGCIALINFLLTALFIQDEYKPASARQDSLEGMGQMRVLWGHYRAVLRDGRFLLFILASILIVSLEFQIDKYIGVRLGREFHQTLFGADMNGMTMLSVIIGINTVTIAGLTLVVAKKITARKSPLIFYIGLLGYTAAFSVMAVSNSLVLLVIAALVFTLGEMVYMPVRQSLMADLIRDDARSSYLAVSNLTFQISAILGGAGLLIGSYVNAYGMAALYMIMGLGSAALFKLIERSRMTEKLSMARDKEQEAVSQG